ALPEIVQQERRKDETKPGESDRSLAEVSHVRVQRFCPRHGENDRTEDEEARLAVGHEELQSVPGIQREEDARLARDLRRPEDRDREEPERHQWPEGAADARGSEALKDE